MAVRFNDYFTTIGHTPAAEILVIIPFDPILYHASTHNSSVADLSSLSIYPLAVGTFGSKPEESQTTGQCKQVSLSTIHIYLGLVRNKSFTRSCLYSGSARLLGHSINAV